MKAGLPPIARDDARVLILGSLPGDASIAEQQYYAHPRNSFWQLIGAVSGRDFAALSYDDRTEAIKESGIALWDVIATARRQGSLDSAIVDARFNEIAEFARKLPLLRAIAFNGKTAALHGRKAVAGLSVAIIDLPSSSPAHAVTFATKRDRWMRLRAYLENI